jgi:hypothetical protein
MRPRNGIVCRVLLGTLGAGIIFVGTGSACDVEIPPCPGQCVDFTLELPAPVPCRDEESTEYPISFTGTNPDGYRGRSCFNSTSVVLVVEAIDHLRAGGRLSDIDPEMQSAYLTTVNTVRADLEAECITAAPGQCTNAAEVCSVVGSDMYVELVVEETCVLQLDGTEPVALGPGQVCEPIFFGDQTTGSAGSGDHCIEPTSSGDDGLDDTAGSDGVDETGEGTTGMMVSTNRRAR